jgi:integrase
VRRFTPEGGSPSAVAYYRDSAGKRRRMLRTGATEAAAERALVAALKEATGQADGEILTKDSTVLALSRVWFEEMRGKGRKSGTLRTYMVNLDGHIRPGIGELRLYEATVPRVDRFLKALAASSGPGTATTARVVLKGMFGLAVRHGAMRENPVPATAPATRKRAKPVSPDKDQVIGIRSRFLEWDRMLDGRGQPRTSRLFDTVEMLTGTGVRTGELLALKWTDVDLLNATVTIRRTLAESEDGRVYVQDLTKTDEERTLHLPAQVSRMLARRDRDSVFVFPSSVGTFWHPANYRTRWRDALRGTPYEGTTPKAFRKLVATTLQRALGSRAAGDQLGHASERTTEQFYIEPSRQGPATDVLSDLFALKVASK